MSSPIIERRKTIVFASPIVQSPPRTSFPVQSLDANTELQEVTKSILKKPTAQKVEGLSERVKELTESVDQLAQSLHTISHIKLTIASSLHELLQEHLLIVEFLNQSQVGTSDELEDLDMEFFNLELATSEWYYPKSSKIVIKNLQQFIRTYATALEIGTALSHWDKIEPDLHIRELYDLLKVLEDTDKRFKRMPEAETPLQRQVYLLQTFDSLDKSLELLITNTHLQSKPLSLLTASSPEIYQKLSLIKASYYAMYQLLKITDELFYRSFPELDLQTLSLRAGLVGLQASRSAYNPQGSTNPELQALRSSMDSLDEVFSTCSALTLPLGRKVDLIRSFSDSLSSSIDSLEPFQVENPKLPKKENQDPTIQMRAGKKFHNKPLPPLPVDAQQPFRPLQGQLVEEHKAQESSKPTDAENFELLQWTTARFKRLGF